MRRIPTMMASAGAAALSALAVSVAVPALGDGGGSSTSDAPDTVAPCTAANERDCGPKPVPEADRAAEEQKLRACLAAHGADVPDAGGADLKRWVLEHHTEAATAAALKACHLEVSDRGGPSTADCRKADGPAGEGSGGQPADKPDASAAKIVRHSLKLGT